MKMAALKGLAVANFIVAFSLHGWAQEPDIGKTEYQSSCAACHGIDGKGTGPLAEELKTKPADLTMIAKRNNGVFPFNHVYDTIDGRQEVKSHGPREMPIWGLKYTNPPSPVQGSSPVDPIKALVDYVYRIQEK